CQRTYPGPIGRHSTNGTQVCRPTNIQDCVAEGITQCCYLRQRGPHPEMLGRYRSVRTLLRKLSVRPPFSRFASGDVPEQLTFPSFKRNAPFGPPTISKARRDSFHLRKKTYSSPGSNNGKSSSSVSSM